MADVNEVLSALQTALDEVNSSISAAGQAESEAEDLVGTMSAANVTDKAQEFQAVQEAIEKARMHLSSGMELLEEAVTLAQAAAG